MPIKTKPASRTTPPKNGKPVRKPLWGGPCEEGITFSLLSKFLVCRERFRKRVVEGLVEDMGFNHAIEYGSMWHEAEEALASGKPDQWLQRLTKYKSQLLANYPADERQVVKWFEIAKRQFPIYLEHWKKHADEKSRKPILEEIAFRVPYVLPSGRTVLLRGKWDAVMVLDAPSKRTDPALHKAWKENWPNASCGIVNQENKTKGSVDEDGLLRTIFGNLQTMLYHVTLRHYEEAGSHDLTFLSVEQGAALVAALQKYPVTGILYNVIRRPLSDRYAPKQKKTETERQFYDRVAQIIQSDPKHWFMRWRCILSPTDIERFKREIFDPLLEQLCDWWEWILVDPFDPWRPRRPSELGGSDYVQAMNNSSSIASKFTAEVLKGLDDTLIPNRIHWQAPWGVYDSLASGFRGDYFEYLTRGHVHGLKKIKQLFPELEPKHESADGK